MNARAAFLCVLASFGGVDAAAQEASTVKPVSQGNLRELAARALLRDPRALPFAAMDRWTKWGPKDEVPAELQLDLRAGMRAYTAGDYAASLAFFYRLLDREAEYPPALYQGGLCYFRLRRYGDSAAMLERFVHAAPQEIGASQALGHCYYSLGDYERARAHYLKVIATSRSSPEALRGLALCELRLGNPARALELLDEVLALRPDHADAHSWRAQILFDEGESEKALTSAERARDLEPWEPRAWFMLSRIYFELDRTAEAEEARKRFDFTSRLAQQVRQQEGLLLHDPARVDVWAQLISLQRSGGNKSGVRDAVQHLAALGPRDARTALLVIDAFEWLGESVRARGAARHAEAVVGTEKSAWEWLADFYRRTGDVPGAERATKAAEGQR